MGAAAAHAARPPKVLTKERLSREVVSSMLWMMRVGGVRVNGMMLSCGDCCLFVCVIVVYGVGMRAVPGGATAVGGGSGREEPGSVGRRVVRPGCGQIGRRDR